MEKKEVWTTSDILANRNNWSLASDAELLKHLQSLSEKIFTKANTTLQSLNTFENDVNQTCISVANTNNKFKALSDTQFIESKVQDESEDIDEPSATSNEPPENAKNENTTVQLKEALENGFQVLDTHYDIIPVTCSDSEDDDPQEILLRARNPYLTRRLPFIIGSEEFTRNDSLGLVDSSSSEDDEDEDEEDDDDDDDEDEVEVKKVDDEMNSEEEKFVIPKPPIPRTEFTRPQPQVIEISNSDSEDSSISIPSSRSSKKEKYKPAEKPKENEPVQTPYNFADHLSATLGKNHGIGNPYTVIPPNFGDSFSPPPFPGKDANDISSDDDSGDSNVDMFASKKNVKHSTSTSFAKSHNYDDDSDDNDDLYENAKPWRASDIDVISREPPALGKTFPSSRKSSIVSKTSQRSDSSSNPVDDDPKKDIHHDHIQPSKPKIGESNINPLNKKMLSAINAELNEKLKIKTNLTNKPESTSVKSPKLKSTPAKSPKPKVPEPAIVDAKKEVKKPQLFDELDNKSDSDVDTAADLFSGLLHSKPKSSSSKNTKASSLFDDNDNIDNLFKSSKPKTDTAKKPDLDDLFAPKPNEPIKATKIKEPVKPPTVDLLKKSDLFASDSDSEDDIFSIIKGQKKTIKTDVLKPKRNLFEESREKSTEKNTPKLFTTEISNHSVPSVVTKNDEVDIPSTSSGKDADRVQLKTTEKAKTEENYAKNNLFEDTPKSITKDLFRSSDADDNDLFSKSMKSSLDKKTPVRDEIVNKPKSIDLFADNSKTDESKSDTVSGNFSVVSGDQNMFHEKAKLRSKGVQGKPRDDFSSDESLSEVDDVPVLLKAKKPNLFGDVDIFAKNLISRYSSSSEDDQDDIEPSKQLMTSHEKNLFEERIDEKSILEEDLFDKKSISVERNIDDLFDDKSQTVEQKENLFSGQSHPVEKSILEDDLFSKKSRSVEQKENIFKEDLFSEKSQSTEKIVEENIPEADVFGVKSESVEQTENIFKQDLFNKKSHPVEKKIEENIPEADLFGVKSPLVVFEEKVNNDIFSKSSSDDDLFDETSEPISKEPVIDQSINLFHQPVDELFKEKSKGISATANPPNIEPSEEVDSEDEIIDKKIKNEIDLNPRVEDKPKKWSESEKTKTSEVTSPESNLFSIKNDITSGSKPKDIFHESKHEDAGLFNFSKKDLFGSDSDSDELDFSKIWNKESKSTVQSEIVKSSEVPKKSNTLPTAVPEKKLIPDNESTVGSYKDKSPELSKKPTTRPTLVSEKPIQDFESPVSSDKDKSPEVPKKPITLPTPIPQQKPIPDKKSPVGSVKGESPEVPKKPVTLPIPKETPILDIESPVTSVKDQIRQLSQSSEESNGNSAQSSPERGKIGSIFAKIHNTKDDGDEQDGNIFAKNTSPEPVAPTRNVPGKLAVNRRLNINVNALLPGTNWSPKIKQKAEPVTLDEPNAPEPATNLLNSVIKERAKISGKRRPPSRQARKSRIFSGDLFGDTISHEEHSKSESPPLLRAQKRSPIPSPRTSLANIQIPPKIENIKVEAKQSDSGTVSQKLFGECEIDDLFQTIGRKVQEEKKLFGETIKTKAPDVSSSLASSKDSESDGEFNFGIITTPSILPGLTKDRAKPQKRAISKKTPDIPVVVTDKKEEPIRKPAEKPNIFTHEVPSSSTNKMSSSGSAAETVAKSLFDHFDDEDDLFGPPKPKSVERKLEEEVKKDKTASSNPVKAQVAKKSTIDIFNDDDDDELFTPAKKRLSGSKISKKNFLFEDNDDDDLFGTKSSLPSSDKSADPVFSSAKTKLSSEKPRVVKLRSEAVQKDPLTGKDLTNLR